MVAYTQGRDYQLEVRAQGSTVAVLLDGTQLYSGSDSAHERGTTALYAWRSLQRGIRDNIEVTNLTNASSISSYSLILRIASPTNARTVIAGVPLTLSATATDVEDGLFVQHDRMVIEFGGRSGTGASLSVSNLANRYACD